MNFENDERKRVVRVELLSTILKLFGGWELKIKVGTSFILKFSTFLQFFIEIYLSI